MTGNHLLEYLNARLAAAEKDLAGFKNAIAVHGLRVREGDVHGQRDVTDQRVQELVEACEEYRHLIAIWGAE